MTQTVSATALFYASVALLLANLAQDTGDVYVATNIRVNAKFFRTSPFFCLVDSLIVTYRLLTGCRAPRSIARKVLLSRFFNVTVVKRGAGSGNYAKDEDAYIAMRERLKSANQDGWWWRTMLNLFAVAQVAKLMVFEGTPAFKVLGAFYFVSIVTTTLLFFLAFGWKSESIDEWGVQHYFNTTAATTAKTGTLYWLSIALSFILPVTLQFYYIYTAKSIVDYLSLISHMLSVSDHIKIITNLWKYVVFDGGWSWILAPAYFTVTIGMVFYSAMLFVVSRGWYLFMTFAVFVLFTVGSNAIVWSALGGVVLRIVLFTKSSAYKQKYTIHRLVILSCFGALHIDLIACIVLALVRAETAYVVLTCLVACLGLISAYGKENLNFGFVWHDMWARYERVFAFQMMAILGVYLFVEYQPVGTAAPAWTDYLG